MEIIILLAAPIIATVLSAFVQKNIRILGVLSVLSAIMQFIAAGFIASRIIGGLSVSYTDFLSVDPFGSLLILITAFLGVIATFYSIGYLDEEVKQDIIGFRRVKELYILLNLFLLAMHTAVAATNPIVAWIAIEATTLSTAFLVSFYSKPSDIEAAWKYLILNSVGLLLAFLGTIMYLVNATPFTAKGFITWHDLTSIANVADPVVTKIAFVLILIGYGTKMGLAPMHTWRPETYSKAPVPVVILLSGALLNIAFYIIIRFKLITDLTVDPSFTQNLMLFFGALSIGIASLAIFNQQNYKRLLAYSSVEHSGIMLLGFAFGGIGIYASILHMVYHSLAKALLFLLSGNIWLRYNSTEIKDIRNLITVLPTTGMMFILGFLAITGVPPFGLFFTKFYILLAGMTSHPIITTILIFFLGLIFYGFLKNISLMMFGDVSENIKKGDRNWYTIFPAVVILVVLMILGIFLPDQFQIVIQNIILSLKNNV